MWLLPSNGCRHRLVRRSVNLQVQAGSGDPIRVDDRHHPSVVLRSHSEEVDPLAHPGRAVARGAHTVQRPDGRVT